jgi:hypothetical protein
VSDSVSYENENENVSGERRSIELHIEELVLHGFSAGDRYRIADGLQVELERLLTEGNLSLSTSFDTRLESLDAGVVRVGSESKSGLIGGQVARALLRGVARSAGSGAGSKEPFEGNRSEASGTSGRVLTREIRVPE